LEGVALAHGLILAVIVFTFGHVSGAHVNPAVTVGLWLGGKVSASRAIAYLIAQFAGGALAGFAIGFVVPDPGGYGQTVMGIGLGAGLFLEALLTFFLVSSVYQAAVYGKAGGLAPLAIGLTLAASILVGGPLTGASLNPARSFGPALAGGGMADFWPYLVGPVVGGLAAGVLHTRVFGDK
jgi:MIP family channel proteins